MSKNIYEIIKGVHNANSKDLDALYLFLNNGRSFAQIRKQGFNQYDAEDIFFDAFEILERKIKTEKFTIEKDDDESKQRNMVQKYFLAQITGCITSIRRSKSKNISLDKVRNFVIFDDSNNQMDQLSLIGRTMELIRNIGSVCEQILVYALVENLSNKEIAKRAINSTLTETAQVTERKISCLRKLYDNLTNKLNQLDGNIKNDYLKAAFSTIQTLEEPCKTILQLHFREKTNQMIAVNLQETLPLSLVTKLKTEGQVKKKKTRCFEGYRVSIVQHILNQN